MDINTKTVPAIITLAAACISCVISIMQKVDFSIFVGRLVIVVVVFLVLGTIVKMVLDYSFKTLEPPVEEVSEEEAETQEATTDATSEQTEEDISSENLQESTEEE